MNIYDLYYRALVDYRKITKESQEATTYRSIAASVGTENDRIEIIRSVCKIDEEWVNQIESGLVYIEKAIAEQRQFIQSNGEVMPIEKIKHVSKESVEHLAKHTNLVDRIPEEGEPLIPSSLYSVERFSDFAVYENRFLYLVLTYLRSFIQDRYEKILERTNTYRGKLKMKKTISFHGETLEYSCDLNETRLNDQYLSTHNKSKEIIDRINNCLIGVEALLATPLMEEVAKVPMIKPPITRTNVLKMNHNFKNALALYSFITDYQGDGYTITEETKVLTPFGDDAGDEFSEVIFLSAFLTYEHGLDIKKLYKSAYEKEELRRKEEEDLRLQEKIRTVRRHVKENGGDPDEYMALLEGRNKSLENDHANLAASLKTIEKMAAEAEDLTEQIESLEEELDESQQELAQATYTNAKQLSEFKLKLAAMEAECDERIEEMEESRDEEIAAAVNTEKLRLKADMEHKDQVIEMMYQDKQDSDRAHAQKLQAANMQFAAKEQELTEKQKELIALQTEFAHLKARLNSLRSAQGLEGEMDDYTTEEGFAQLEKEYEYFQQFFEKEWNKTKKSIRKKVLRKPAKELKEEIKKDKEAEKEAKGKTPKPEKQSKEAKTKKVKTSKDEVQDEIPNSDEIPQAAKVTDEIMSLDDFMDNK